MEIEKAECLDLSGLPQTVAVLTHPVTQAQLFIVGTAHVSKHSRKGLFVLFLLFHSLPSVHVNQFFSSQMF